MDQFTDQISNDFLPKEWLVKLGQSRPYLFKFLKGPDSQCSILVADTVNVWFEVVNSKQLARRWRRLNKSDESFSEDDKEYGWRAKAAQKVSNLHTMKHIQDCNFSIETSRDADLAIELQLSDYKWCWECYTLGPKTSAEVLSKHLILPLISATNLAFTSADSVSELSISDLQNAVDKVGRTGRRAQDVHVRKTLSRPRIATTLARLTGIFNFIEPTPGIISELDEVEEGNEGVEMKSESPRGISLSEKPSNVSTKAAELRNDISVPLSTSSRSALRQNQNSSEKFNKSKGKNKAPTPPLVIDSGSATEPESGEDGLKPSTGEDDVQQTSAKGTDVYAKENSPVATTSRLKHDDTESDSSPPRPLAKKKRVATSDSDSGATRGSRQGSKPPVRSLGVRQPIKRGGRRF